MIPRVILLVILGAFWWIVVTGPGDAVTQEENLIRKIFADWENRRAAMPAVRYRITGTRFWPQGAFNEELGEDIPGPIRENPEHDIKGKLDRTLLLDFRHNRHHIEKDDGEYDNLSQQPFRIRANYACDGKISCCRILENSDPGLGLRRVKKHVDMMIDRGRVPMGIFDHRCMPLFLGHGVVTYNYDVRVRPGVLAPKANPADFIYRGKGIHAGRQCAIFRTVKARSTETEFWIDMERSSAVVKIVHNPESQVVSLTTEIQYRETPQGWLVKNWRNAEMVAGNLRYQEDINVEAITANPPLRDEDFSMDPGPGMYIQDEYYFINPQTMALDSAVKYYRIEPRGQRTYLNADLYPIHAGEK